jgi:hypothetical protein
LLSPLAGDAPALDALLAWELHLRLGSKHAKKVGRWTPAEELEDAPIPLARRKIFGETVYCCSDPILPPLLAPEWVDRQSKRFESSKMAKIIAPEHRKSIMTASGPYKSRFTPLRIRYVERVCWFACGDRAGMYKLLKSIRALGHLRNIGYGWVWKWDFEELHDDYSIFAPHKGKKVLMRTLPLGKGLENVCGYRKGYAAVRPPYWHPDRQMEAVIPC